MLMIYHHTKFYMPRSNDSLIIAIKREDNYKFRATTMLFHN